MLWAPAVVGGGNMASYIERSLSEGEHIVARAKFHWVYTLQATLLLILLGWVLIGIYLYFEMMAFRWTTEIGITNYRFIKKTGLFRLQTEEITLDNVEGVKVNQSFFGQIFGYGKLTIEGTGVDDILVPNIADPIGFRRYIHTQH
jgi:uncharacterized membrane protein YdbT with pleckstrin-like domain